MVDLRQSPQWAAYMEEIGWSVEKIGPRGKEQFGYLKKIPFFGSVLKIPRPVAPLPLKAIDELAIEKKIAFVKIEPNFSSKEKKLTEELAANKFKADRWALQPTKTIVMDLRKSDEELLSAMEKDTRYSIRAAQRRGVRIVKSNDLERFLKLYRQTAKRKGFLVVEKELRVLWDIFEEAGKAFILFSQWNKGDIAACLILHHDRKAYYYHAASVNRLRELYAPYLLIWEAMATSKELKLKELDLEGVFDPRIASTKNWKGFSHFKKGFRGEEVELAGSFVKTYSGLANFIYKFNFL